VWQPLDDSLPDLAKLVELRAGSGETLATFTHEPPRLLSASSAAGDEQYGYDAYIDAEGDSSSYKLATISRDGTVAIDVAYEDVALRRRVKSVSAPDGSYVIRYASEPTNVCGSTSPTIVDRSTEPQGGVSCMDDGDCPIDTVCEDGLCRAYTCQDYLQDGSRTDWNLPVSVSGNCPCGGTGTLTWDTSGSGPARLASHTDRDGTITTFDHDAMGRVIARCVNDSDTTVTTDPSSCPASGRWTRWQYSTTWPQFPALERRRSMLSAGAFADTSYSYLGDLPKLQSVERSGYTRNAAGAIVADTLSESWTYDSLGRMLSHTDRDGAYTTYSYHPLGGGNESGLVDTVSRHVDGLTLDTSYFSYWPIGTPGAIQRPSSGTEYRTYDYAGARISARTNGSTSFTYGYTAGGRLETINGGSTTTRFVYDATGRVSEIRRENPVSSYDKTSYSHDEAGRVTSVEQRRVDSSGSEGPVTYSMSYGYEDHGYLDTVTAGSNAPVTITRDPAGMGLPKELDLGDGDPQRFTHDALTRTDSLTRDYGSSEGTYGLDYTASSGTTSYRDRPTTVTAPNATTRDYEYDDFGQLVEATSTDFGTLQTVYAGGQKSEIDLPDGTRRELIYDELGRLTFVDNDADNPSLVGPDYRFVYDNGDGSVACNVTVSSGTPCAYRAGKLARVEFEQGSTTNWNTIEYDYAEDGRVRVERRDGLQIEYEYDPQGRLARLHYPTLSDDQRVFEYHDGSIDGHDQSEVEAVDHYVGSYFWFPEVYDMRYDPAGRLNEAWFAEVGDPSQVSSPSLSLERTLDGQLDWVVAGRYVSTTTGYAVMFRDYHYAFDGMLAQIFSYVNESSDRAFFYDDANRLICASSDENDSSCPSDADLLASFDYDDAGNRELKTTPGGDTTYTHSNNRISQQDYPGGSIQYGYDSSRRSWDKDYAYADPDKSLRDFYYDGYQRVELVKVRRPTTVDSYDLHYIWMYYDHEAHPVQIVDQNMSAGSPTRVQDLYWDLDDRLITRIVTPDSASPGDYTIEMYGHIGDYAVVSDVRTYVADSYADEHVYYTLRDQVGLPVARYEYIGYYDTDEVWRAESWSPYGELLQESGDPALRPIWRFFGQLAIEGSAAEGWIGGAVVESRPELYLNRWRVYDPQVGQYTSPEPNALDGQQASTHPYAYADLRPTAAVDVDGRLSSCTTPSGAPVCAAAAAAAKTAARGLAYAGTGAGLGAGAALAKNAADNALERTCDPGEGPKPPPIGPKPPPDGPDEPEPKCHRIDPPPKGSSYRDHPNFDGVSGVCTYVCDGREGEEVQYDCPGGCPKVFLANASDLPTDCDRKY